MNTNNSIAAEPPISGDAATSRQAAAFSARQPFPGAGIDEAPRGRAAFVKRSAAFARSWMLLAMMGAVFAGGTARTGAVTPVGTTTTYRAVWSGSVNGNGADAVAFITMDTSRVPNPIDPATGDPSYDGPVSGSFITALSMTVTGASAGNGKFPIGSFDTVVWDTNLSTLDLTTELVGQVTQSGEGWGTPDGGAGDFNLFTNGSNPNVPLAIGPFTLQTAGGEPMTLVSFAPSTGGGGTGGGVQAVSGDAAPGVDDAVFKTFGSPALNAAGGLAFQATIKGTLKKSLVKSYNNSGIWADDSTGARTLVVRTNDAAAGTFGATFKTLGDPVFNNDDEVAFLGTVVGGDTGLTPSGVKNNTGIWMTIAGVPTLVARAGDTADGSDGAVFSKFLQFALPDTGGVVFLAKLASGSVTAASDQAIFAVDDTGVISMIAREGGVAPDALGSPINVLTFLPVAPNVSGQTRSFDQGSGNLVYRATFVGGGAGIFPITLGMTTSVSSKKR